MKKKRFRFSLMPQSLAYTSQRATKTPTTITTKVPFQFCITQLSNSAEEGQPQWSYFKLQPTMTTTNLMTMNILTVLFILIAPSRSKRIIMNRQYVTGLLSSSSGATDINKMM